MGKSFIILLLAHCLASVGHRPVIVVTNKLLKMQMQAHKDEVFPELDVEVILVCNLTNRKKPTNYYLFDEIDDMIDNHMVCAHDGLVTRELYGLW